MKKKTDQELFRVVDEQTGVLRCLQKSICLFASTMDLASSLVNVDTLWMVERLLGRSIMALEDVCNAYRHAFLEPLPAISEIPIIPAGNGELKWLIEIRKARGLTQKYVAEQAGISQPSYFNIEHGARGLAVPTAKAIAGVLGFDWTRFYEQSQRTAEEGR